MSVALTVMLTVAAGSIGAALRALVVRWSPSAGTAIVNVGGTFVLALTLVGHAAGAVTTSGAVVLGVGLSGALTTFSGWMAEIEEGLRVRPVTVLLARVLVPLLLGVALTVVAFAVIA
jgi:fluoride ion exporter CrcB/FEX